MDVPAIVNSFVADLQHVARCQPNERLPKEEQLRCSIYHAIRSSFDTVCVERGYASVDECSRIECDIWATREGHAPMRLELKKCWSAKGWVRKPLEQRASWEKDIGKLRFLPVTADRYFMLAAFSDFDPLNESNSKDDIVARIRTFYPESLSYSLTKPFKWRPVDGIRWISAWSWQWDAGFAIPPRVSATDVWPKS